MENYKYENKHTNMYRYIIYEKCIHTSTLITKSKVTTILVTNFKTPSVVPFSSSEMSLLNEVSIANCTHSCINSLFNLPRRSSGIGTSTDIYIYIYIYMSICMSTCMSISMSTCMSNCKSVYVYIYI